MKYLGILVVCLIAFYFLANSLGEALDAEYEYRLKIVEQHLKDVQSKEYKE